MPNPSEGLHYPHHLHPRTLAGQASAAGQWSLHVVVHWGRRASLCQSISCDLAYHGDEWAEHPQRGEGIVGYGQERDKSISFLHMYTYIHIYIFVYYVYIYIYIYHIFGCLQYKGGHSGTPRILPSNFRWRYRYVGSLYCSYGLYGQPGISHNRMCSYIYIYTYIYISDSVIFVYLIYI